MSERLPTIHSLRRALSASLRLCRGMRGRSRIANYAHQRYLHGGSPFQIGDWCRARRFLFDLGESQQRMAYYLGDFLDRELNLIVGHLKRHPGIFLDVGANVGLYSVGIATLLPGTKCMAFEPGRRNFEQLAANIVRNGLDQQIEPLPVALGDAAGSHYLAYGRTERAEGSANAAIVDDWRPKGCAWMDGDFEHLERVACISFDDWWRNRGSCERIAFAKLDIEGHEPKAIAGMRRTIERHRPALYLEMNSFFLRQKGLSRFPAEEFLQELGYRAFRLDAAQLFEIKAAPGQHGEDVFWYPREIAAEAWEKA